MNFCPKCRKKLIVQDFCVECGADLSEYLNNNNVSTNDSLGSFDFSKMESEAQRQLSEQREKEELEIFCQKAQIENGVLLKYNGKDKNVVIPSGIVSIGYEAFAYNSSLISIDFNGVTEIGVGAFRSCNGLKSITIPKGVDSIGAYCFINCENLTNVKISSSVKEIGENAFANCPRLEKISVDVKNENYKSIDGDLYSKDGKILIRYANGKNQSQFLIPDCVTQLGVCALSNSVNLTKVIIPNGVKIIQASVFLNCSRIKKVTIPRSVDFIDLFAFNGLDAISVYIPKGKNYELNCSIDYVEY